VPSALRRALPAYGNEAILMLHATSIASAAPGIVDLTGPANPFYATTYVPFEACLAAVAVYPAMTFVLIGILRVVERRALAHLRCSAPCLRAMRAVRP
jgi:arginine/ornithine transport system permease protein